jgi:hypothetical protein
MELRERGPFGPFRMRSINPVLESYAVNQDNLRPHVDEREDVL